MNSCPSCFLLIALSLACSIVPTQADEAQHAALEKLGAKLTLTGGVLTQLQVKADTFTDAEFRLIASCSTLKRLSISGKTIDDRSLPILAALENLEELSTDQTQLSDEGYRGFLGFKNLKMLALFHPSWDKKEFTGKGLAYLKELPKLERLTFAGSTAGDEAMKAVGEITQLREFRTWHTRQTQAGNEHLLKLEKLTALRLGQRLPKWGEDSAPSFNDATIALLAKIGSLEKLELTEARLSAAGLAPLAKLPQLKTIVIQQTAISESDVAALKASLPNVKIEHQPLSAEEEESLLVKKLRLPK